MRELSPETLAWLEQRRAYHASGGLYWVMFLQVYERGGARNRCVIGEAIEFTPLPDGGHSIICQVSGSGERLALIQTPRQVKENRGLCRAAK